MPQIDTVTFLTIAFWITTLYVLQYLLLNLSHLYIFFNTMKLKLKRISSLIQRNLEIRYHLRNLLVFF